MFWYMDIGSVCYFKICVTACIHLHKMSSEWATKPCKSISYRCSVMLKINIRHITNGVTIFVIIQVWKGQQHIKTMFPLNSD